MTPRRLLRVACVTSLLASISLVSAGPASAATITVTTTADEYGTGAGCSLREAIQAINQEAAFGGCPAGMAKDRIDLPQGIYTLTLGGIGEDLNATGDLDLNADLSIRGDAAGTTEIVGMGDRVIEVHSASPSVIQDVTVRGGSGVGPGGGIYVPDGPVDLTLRRVILGPNSATFGGGLYVQAGGPAVAAVAVVDSTIVDNSAGEAGGGILSSGGGAEVTVERSLITENLAATFGDGVAEYGSVTIRDSTIANNGFGVVGDQGGGIYSQTEATLENVTMIDNEGGAASNTGGHLYQNGGTLTVRNVLMDESPISGACANIGNGANYFDQGTNLIEASGSCQGFTQSNALGLGTLGPEGGPTESVPISAGSDARGDADDAYCGSTDQRGVPRPNGSCDVGAYQFETCFGVPVNRVGTPGGDVLAGDPVDRDESFLMLGGNDRVRAGAGVDTACGGSGRDKLLGGAGRDKLDGDAGKDLCNGQGGRDQGRACERVRSIP